MVIGVLAALLVTAQASRPAAPSADLLLAAAIKRAATEHKAILADFNAPWCGPCRRLLAFLHAPDIEPIIERHYVVLLLTVFEDKDKAYLNNPGAEMLYTKFGGASSLPFFAVLDSGGVELGSSNAMPDGSDIGYPGNNASIHAFVSLVEKTAPRMTASERATIVEYLTTHSNGLGSIGGRVVDGSGQPLTGVKVVAMERTYSFGQWTPLAAARAVTNDSGRFVMEDLAAGEYRLRVLDSAPATGNVAKATPLTLVRNQEATGIDLLLSRAPVARVSGSVLDAGGLPLVGGSVVLTNVEWPDDVYRVTTGAGGVFELRTVPPGSYALWVRAAAELGSASIVVQGSDVSGVRVATQKGRRITGAVRFDGPMTAADRAAIRISAVAIDPPPGATPGIPDSVVRADGVFDLAGVFGSRIIRAQNLPQGWMLKSVSQKGRDLTDRAIDTSGDAALDDLDVVLTSRTGQVTGTALDAAGRPLRGGAVILFAADASRWIYPSRFVQMAPIDAGGGFSVRTLLPGNYLVAAAVASPANWDAPESLDRLRSAATPTTVVDGERRQIVVRMISR